MKQSKLTDLDNSKIESLFPFDDYRQHQKEILLQAKHALFERDSIDTVVVDAPTGIGKSPVNMALAKYAGSAFYTTPQKKLRNQLQSDESLSHLHKALRARRDYTCRASSEYKDAGTTYDCESCPVNQKESLSCRNFSCPYWGAKKDAMHADVATLTFSFLIVDGRLPAYVSVPDETSAFGEKEIQISFTDRDLLIIDEAHTLEEQVASLHAGFTLSYDTLNLQDYTEYIIDKGGASKLTDPERIEEPDPYAVFNEAVAEALDDKSPSVGLDSLGGSDMSTVLEKVHQESQSAIEKLTLYNTNDTGAGVIKRLKKLNWKIENVLRDLKNDKPWVVDAESLVNNSYSAELKPVYVDDFLSENVWNRADNILLSTATMPYRDDPGKWLDRIGLDRDRAVVISKPMPFAPDNRLIRADYQIGNMSGGGVSDHWDAIINTIRELAEKHSGQKGIIHTVSYNRAEKVHDELPMLTTLHESDDDADAETVITQWQKSGNQILLTPSMTEGVDLEGDACRWQVLLKTPYKSLGDPRVDYLLNQESDWEWYNDVTAREIIQSVGRAVRSPKDHATYYVFDEKFDTVLSGRMPQWFEDAIVRG